MVGVESQQHRTSGLDSLEALYSASPGAAPNNPEKGVDCEGDAVMASARSQSDRARKAAGVNQNQARKSGMKFLFRLRSKKQILFICHYDVNGLS